MSDPEEMKVPHDELCDKALEHYREISTTAMHSNSLVPAAIKFYKERWVPTGERKIVRTPGLLMEALEEGWVFDPWLSTRGGPIIIGDLPYRGDHPALSAVDPREPSVYWVLVKGSPEQIAALEPFVELPKTEEPMPASAVIPYAVRSEYIAYNDKGEPSRTPKKGYVIMHKDHLYAKGAVYSLPPGEDAMQRSNAEMP